MILPYIVAAFFASVVWGLFALLATMGQLFAARSERTGRAATLFFFWLSVAAMLGAALIPFLALQLGRPDSAMQFVIANTITGVGVSLGIYWVYGRFVSLSAGGGQLTRGRRGRGRTISTFGATGVTIMILSMGNYFATSTLMPSPRSGAMMVCAATFILSIVIIRFQRRLHGVGAKGTPFPLDESPLRDELLEIATAFGADGTKLRVSPTKSADGESDELTPTQISSVVQSWVFHARRKPEIPIELFQHLNPSELTALIAIRYAIALPPNRTGYWWRIPLVILAGLAIFAAFGATIAAVFQAYSPQLVLRGILIFAAFYAGIYLLLCTLRSLGLLRRPPMLWVDGFAAWKAAAPEGEARDFIDFTLALLAFDALLHATPRDRQLVTLLGKNVHIIKAANLVAGLSREEYLAAVGARVDAAAPSPVVVE